MRYSITSAAAGGCDPATLADLAAQAERSGWDGFFLEDYLVYQGREDVPTYDPWIALAAMACATTRLILGTTVTPVSRRRPWQVAAEAMTLNQLAGGRFVLGVGSGNAGDVDFAATGEPGGQRELAERMDEALEIISGLLAGRRVHHEGRHFTVTGLRFAAAAAGQRPRVPIWIGGNLLAPAVRRRIGRWDGSCAYKGPIGSALGPVTPEDVADLKAYVAESRGSAARFDIKITAVDDAELLAEYERAGATWAGVWVDPTDAATLRQVIATGPPRVPGQSEVRVIP